MSVINLARNYSEESAFILGDIDPYSRSDLNQYDSSDLIHLDNEYWADEDKEDKKYYLGSCYLYRNDEDSSFDYWNDYIYLSIVLCPNIFMNYQIEDIITYLYEYGEYNTYIHCDTLQRRSYPELDILQVRFRQDGQFAYSCVVVKTCWIRLIQRVWKKIFKKRKHILKERSKVDNLKYREITGNFPYELKEVPSLYGMLNTIL